MSATDDWYWEGNVVIAIANHLRKENWTIISAADTSTKERGPDIHARREGKDLYVEAKGYPSTTYRDPRRAGEAKPTNPTIQAQHWYSHALLKLLRMQYAHPEAIIALGLPDFPRYSALLNETRWALDALGIVLITSYPDGSVLAPNLPKALEQQPTSKSMV